MKHKAAAAVLLLSALAAACTSTEATLNPASIDAPPAPVPAAEAADAAVATPPGTAAPPVSSPGQMAALAPGSARVRIAPVIGAPAQAIGPLSERLTARASEKRFAIVRADDPSATHILKGFFSTSPEGRETVIYYVWDVMDNGGNRVHRFSGQEKVAGGNGWSGVTEATMQKIADRTADEFALWLAGRAS